MSRVRDNSLPEIEEISGPRIAVDDDDLPAAKRRRKPYKDERTPTEPTVILTPTSVPDEPLQPEPDTEQRLRKRKSRKKDDSELVLGILNMMMSRVDENSNDIKKYVLKRYEGDDMDDGMVRRDKISVEVRVVFMRVIDVDTLKQQFKAELFIQARWLEPKLKGFSDDELMDFDASHAWTPKLFVSNLVGDPDDDNTWFVAQRYEEFKHPTVTMRRQITGNFSEILELNDFPLDVQELTVQISTKRNENEVRLVQDNYRISTCNTHSFLDQDQFELFPHVMCSSGHIASELTSLKDKHSAIYFSASVKRKAGYFFWNIFLIMFIISTLAFTAYAIVPTNPQNRLSVSLTLLLTGIAFKFIINKSIPQIPYLTYLDIYVLGCMVLLSAQAIQNAVITVWSGNALQTQIDQYMLYFLATCHFSFNIAYGIFLIIMNHRSNKEVADRNKEHKIQKKVVDERRSKMKVPVDEDMYSELD